MGRPQGTPKTGGRIKGTPNRSSLDFQEALQGFVVDIVAELIRLLPQLEVSKRVDILVSLMSYVYPRRKAVEVSSAESISPQSILITLPQNGREAPAQKS